MYSGSAVSVQRRAAEFVKFRFPFCPHFPQRRPEFLIAVTHAGPGHAACQAGGVFEGAGGNTPGVLDLEFDQLGVQATFVPSAGPVRGQALDDTELLVKAVDQALQGVTQEGGQAVSPLAGTLQATVVLRPRAVVMGAQQIRCRPRQAGLAQQAYLQQTRRAAVAIAEGMNPGDVEVGEDGLAECRKSDARRRWRPESRCSTNRRGGAAGKARSSGGAPR